MRGMIKGEWHVDLAQASSWNDEIAASFQTPASRVPIDLERLKDRPESYHIYGALACPFAHRVVMAHALFELEGIMPLTLAGPWLGGPDGWTFRSDQGSPVPDATKLWQVYATSDPSYTGRITVPVLWDIDAKAIASAESGEILACFIKAFSGKRGRMTVISAAEHRELAALCAWIKDRVNLGVYRIGFSSDQASYDRAYDSLAEALACLEARLSGRRYVWGNGLSEADLLLFATAVRFDTAYHGAFQILGLRWHDHPNLHAHLQRMLMLHAIERTVSTADYRVHYFDDAAFSIRHPGPDGRYIVPRTAKLM